MRTDGASSAVWCQFALNAGMTQENLNARIEIIPHLETLRQGRKNVGDQFSYRYSCDERTVIAAVVKFHRGLWFTILASSDQRDRELLSKPDFLQLPASVMVRPGSLLSLLPVPAVTARERYACGFFGNARVARHATSPTNVTGVKVHSGSVVGWVHMPSPDPDSGNAGLLSG
jgi:hypothetical protein